MDEAVPISNRIVCFEAEAHPVTKYSVSTSSHERKSERERAKTKIRRSIRRRININSHIVREPLV